MSKDNTIRVAIEIPWLTDDEVRGAVICYGGMRFETATPIGDAPAEIDPGAIEFTINGERVDAVVTAVETTRRSGTEANRAGAYNYGGLEVRWNTPPRVLVENPEATE